MRRLRLLSVHAPAAPAAAICLVALAAVGLHVHGTNRLLFGLAAAIALVTVAAAALAPWSRLPLGLVVVLAMACDLVIGLLRHASGGTNSGYAPLAVLPALWVGLVLGRRSIAVITASTAATLLGPTIAFGAPLYPAAGLRGSILVSVVAWIVSAGAYVLMNAQRRQTALADARARQLDRLVATQQAIATSDVGADAVAETVVAEALRLTGADAAVLELPEGDDIVYHAAAGTAAAHLGMRLPRDTAISGLALAARTALVCSDSETDRRVDRDACRRVGARSMVVVPLVHADTALGVLKVYSDTVAAFDDEHVQVLSLLANMIGTALVRAQLIARLSEQAGTDELTGLPNRRAWREHLALALARSRRSGRPLSVVVLDLDGFKRVNDTRGHAAGDRLLRETTSAWSAALRDPDVLGRLGGDEFGVILEGADADAAASVVARLERSLGERCRASAGAATWTPDEDADGLLARADTAMYAHKRQRVAA
jgi:diguanylate cyclase